LAGQPWEDKGERVPSGQGVEGLASSSPTQNRHPRGEETRQRRRLMSVETLNCCLRCALTLRNWWCLDRRGWDRASDIVYLSLGAQTTHVTPFMGDNLNSTPGHSRSNMTGLRRLARRCQPPWVVPWGLELITVMGSSTDVGRGIQGNGGLPRRSGAGTAESAKTGEKSLRCRIRRGDGTGRATGLRDLEYMPTIQLTTVNGSVSPTISTSIMPADTALSSYLVGGQRRYRQDYTLVSGLPVEHAGCR
jgi:hypothetical protein